MNALANLKGASCSSTKATPCLSADILGDWREEVILWDDKNPAIIYVNTTTKASEHRVPCLMQDHTYRMAICWQNVAYNQPPSPRILSARLCEDSWYKRCKSRQCLGHAHCLHNSRSTRT